MPFPRPLGMSTKKDAAAGAPYAPPQFGRHRTKRKSEPYAKTKAGYHHGDGILPFAIFNRVWYTRPSSTNRNLSGRGPSILLPQDRSVT